MAYLVLADAAPSRQRLAEVLFPETADPLAAVRWSLSQVRQLLGTAAVVEGDPVRLQLATDTTVDVHALQREGWREVVGIRSLDRELLEGLTFRSAPAFEIWLAAARRRLQAVATAVLHEAVLATMSAMPGEAVLHAERLVQIDPHDETHHVLLVRALARSGRAADARARAEECVEFFRRELDVQPTGALRDALSAAPAAPPWASTRSSVRAQLDAGEALVGAGSWPQGVDLFRQAVTGARLLPDPELLSRSLIALGSALVHAARGFDDEGAASLHEGGELAERCGVNSLAATAWRELAWVEFLQARHGRARLWLDRAGAVADAGPEDLAWIAVISGGCHTDAGVYDLAEGDLRRAIDVASQAGLPRPTAFALSLLGRLHLLRDELDLAEAALRRSVEEARRVSWTSMTPWPESLLAEVELRRGNVDAAAEMFEHAFTMGRQLGDPCWESISARGLGLVATARGDIEAGIGMLEQAPIMCRRLPDAYLWIEAYGLEALCATGVAHRLPGTARWIEELEAIADRAGFVELRIRALLHRAELGEPGAYEAACAAAEGVDNPALQRLLAKSG